MNGCNLSLEKFSEEQAGGRTRPPLWSYLLHPLTRWLLDSTATNAFLCTVHSPVQKRWWLFWLGGKEWLYFHPHPHPHAFAKAWTSESIRCPREPGCPDMAECEWQNTPTSPLLALPSNGGTGFPSPSGRPLVAGSQQRERGWRYRAWWCIMSNTNVERALQLLPCTLSAYVFLWASCRIVRLLKHPYREAHTMRKGGLLPKAEQIRHLGRDASSLSSL